MLNEDERLQMTAFIEAALKDSLGASGPVLPFFTRHERDRRVRELRAAGSRFVPMSVFG